MEYLTTWPLWHFNTLNALRNDGQLRERVELPELFYFVDEDRFVTRELVENNPRYPEDDYGFEEQFLLFGRNDTIDDAYDRITEGINAGRVLLPEVPQAIRTIIDRNLQNNAFYRQLRNFQRVEQEARQAELEGLRKQIADLTTANKQVEELRRENERLRKEVEERGRRPRTPSPIRGDEQLPPMPDEKTLQKIIRNLKTVTPGKCILISTGNEVTANQETYFISNNQRFPLCVLRKGGPPDKNIANRYIARVQDEIIKRLGEAPEIRRQRPSEERKMEDIDVMGRLPRQTTTTKEVERRPPVKATFGIPAKYQLPAQTVPGATETLARSKAAIQARRERRPSEGRNVLETVRTERTQTRPVTERQPIQTTTRKARRTTDVATEEEEDVIPGAALARQLGTETERLRQSRRTAPQATLLVEQESQPEEQEVENGEPEFDDEEEEIGDDDE